MRLIDADAVLKWFAEYWAMQKKLGRPSKQQRAIYITMRSMVNSVKTVDAVPVIRCKDCKHYYAINEVRGHCSEHNFAEKIAVDFCSWAERRDNDSN